jgi:undecaprenyl-diphosphatase
VPLLHIVVLAVVQGITEFLPISSQAHLLLTDRLLVASGFIAEAPSAATQLTLSIAVHVGTLGAVMLYFWRDLWGMALGIGRTMRGRQDAGMRLFTHVVVATLPVIVAGYAMHTYGPWGLRGLVVIAWAMLGFGIILYIADRLGMTVRRVEHIAFGDALIVGLAQVLALIPGTSRAGITMAAARMLGFERADAARFSLLLAIPAIAGAGVLEGWQLYRSGAVQLGLDAGLAAGIAFVTAWIAIAMMMAWLRRASFTPFVIYRVILGAVLLAISYGWIA